MTTAIIQARMGSTRLPGKVLREVAGNHILGHLIERLSGSSKIDRIIVATTTLPEDDAIAEWCAANGIACFRGSDWDVLDRFYRAATSLEEQPDTVVRICCDNPLHTYKVADFVIGEFEKAGVDYFSNSNQEPDYLEDGFDTEVFTFAALEDAWKNATLMSEREHVCPYIKKHFRCGWKKAHPGYIYKLSVDTENDLKAVAAIYEELRSDPDFGIEEVVDLLRRKPGILEINKESRINEGFAKSLKEDKRIGE
jgi:spore coat polysaccharide biosynthesis protein SpsF